MPELDPEEFRKLVESQLDELTSKDDENAAEFKDLDNLIMYTTHVFMTFINSGLQEHIALALTECYLSSVIEQLRHK